MDIIRMAKVAKELGYDAISAVAPFMPLNEEQKKELLNTVMPLLQK